MRTSSSSARTLSIQPRFPLQIYGKGIGRDGGGVEGCTALKRGVSIEHTACEEAPRRRTRSYSVSSCHALQSNDHQVTALSQSLGSSVRVEEAKDVRSKTSRGHLTQNLLKTARFATRTCASTDLVQMASAKLELGHTTRRRPKGFAFPRLSKRIDLSGSPWSKMSIFCSDTRKRSTTTNGGPCPEGEYKTRAKICITTRGCGINNCLTALVCLDLCQSPIMYAESCVFGRYMVHHDLSVLSLGAILWMEPEASMSGRSQLVSM